MNTGHAADVLVPQIQTGAQDVQARSVSCHCKAWIVVSGVLIRAMTASATIIGDVV